MDAVKAIELDILKSFIKYCDSNHLTYYLCGGSALGAVRHSGFIPWDDDIDVMMPRADYEQLLERFSDTKYRLYSCWNRDDYYYPFAKIVDEKTVLIEDVNSKSKLGVYIDVFPIENLSSDSKTNVKIYKKRNRFMLDITSKTAIKKKRGLIKSVALLLLKAKNRKKSLLNIVRAFDSYARKISSENDGVLCKGKIIWGYGAKEIMPSNVYAEPVYLLFEGIKVKMPTDWDYYLKSLFGDYMMLPPENKRVNHSIEAYSLEE